MLRRPQKRKLDFTKFDFVATKEKERVGDLQMGKVRNVIVAVLFLLVCRETVRL